MVLENYACGQNYKKKLLCFPSWSPALEVLGRAAAELQGSEAGVELDAQGSLLFMGGTEGGAPHGSTGVAGLGADPGKGRGDFSVGEGGGGSSMQRVKPNWKRRGGTDKESRKK